MKSTCFRRMTVAWHVAWTGQLAGSLLATAYATLLQARSDAGLTGSRLQEAALQAAPMLLSAALLEAAGRMAGQLRAVPPAAAGQLPGKRSRSSPPAGADPQRSPLHASQVLMRPCMPPIPCLAACVCMPQCGHLTDVPLFGGQRAGSGGRGAAAQLRRSFARMWQGFELILASGYLSHLCLYIVLNTVISSFAYFLKSMVRYLQFQL